jgi:hypothetical protein
MLPLVVRQAVSGCSQRTSSRTIQMRVRSSRRCARSSTGSVPPSQWMHHLEILDVGDVDDEVVGWLREAADRAS